MSDDLKDLAKKAMLHARPESSVSDVAKKALLRAAEKADRPKPVRPAAYAEEAPTKGSEDALDRRAFQRGGFSKAEKRAYAQQKFLEDLVAPPKNPPPEWLNDPSLLPKKPPPRRTE